LLAGADGGSGRRSMYENRKASGQLVKIAPRRFNPSHVAWLPVLHTTRGRRHYTALFSNTALAHRLARTDDWVVQPLRSLAGVALHHPVQGRVTGHGGGPKVEVGGAERQR